MKENKRELRGEARHEAIKNRFLEGRTLDEIATEFQTARKTIVTILKSKGIQTPYRRGKGKLDHLPEYAVDGWRNRQVYLCDIARDVGSATSTVKKRLLLIGDKPKGISHNKLQSIRDACVSMARQGYEIDEISERLGITPASANAYIYRYHQRMKRKNSDASDQNKDQNKSSGDTQ